MYLIPANAHTYVASGLNTYVDLRHVSTCHGHPQGDLESKREMY